MLVEGKWIAAWDPIQAKDETGRFLRQPSQFRDTVGPLASPEAGQPRYHLYVALICPWASRTLMARALKGLEAAVSVSVVEPQLTEQGWRFGTADGATPDPELGSTYLHQLYTHTDPNYTGRATVPVLWDRLTQRIVNNESADIVRLLNASPSAAPGSPDLYPLELRTEIDTLNADLYQRLNNGVYRAGFASSQAAYEEPYQEVFSMLDNLESRLSDGRSYLFGERFTESDIRLFVTLVRFDGAYYPLFKCDRNRIADMPHLFAYLQRVLALPGIRETVVLDHIRRGYYSVKRLNPSGIVPLSRSSLDLKVA